MTKHELERKARSMTYEGAKHGVAWAVATFGILLLIMVLILQLTVAYAPRQELMAFITMEILIALLLLPYGSAWITFTIMGKIVDHRIKKMTTQWKNQTLVQAQRDHDAFIKEIDKQNEDILSKW